MFPLAQLYNDMHPPCNKCMEGPKIEDRVVIGAGSILLPKINVGKDSVIAAGSLVTKDVPEGMLVMGSPAKVVGKASDVSCRTGMNPNPYPWTEHYVRPR